MSFTPIQIQSQATQDNLTAKEAEILDYGNKLDVVDTEIQGIKLQIAGLELKKLEFTGTRKQALHVLSRLKIEHDSLKRQYFRELRANP